MKRREFITLLGGAAAAWPLAVRAQRPDGMRRIGVLLPAAANDTIFQTRIGAFLQALALLGWTIGRNVRIDTRWATASADAYEYGMGGKWLELLKDIAPGVRRAAVLRDPAVTSGIGQFGAVQAVAPSLGVELTPVDIRDAGEIERALTAFARGPNGGLIVTGGAWAVVHRELIATLADRHRLPAVYPGRYSVTAGGLISYGPDLIDQFRRAAGYVDRILRGEKAADLPVQAPTKYEMVVNLKAAKAIGITLPDTVLARADEVIE